MIAFMSYRAINTAVAETNSGYRVFRDPQSYVACCRWMNGFGGRIAQKKRVIERHNVRMRRTRIGRAR